MYKTLLFEKDQNIATITLNRPDVFNAFNEEMSYEMLDALKQCTKDAEIRVVVVTGAGRAFCSGQDLKSIAGAKNRNLGDSVKKRYNPMIKAVRNMPKPVICKLNGVAAGAGCSLALACDVIIASEKASLVEVFINVGLVLDSGSSYFLPRIVGSNKAFELATKATKVPAAEALRLGMVNKVVVEEALNEAVAAEAQYYAKAPTKAIGMIKKMLDRSFYSSLDEMLEMEGYYQEIAGNSADYKEGVQAFIEKRNPEFKGE